MGEVYVWSDLHAGHQNIIKYCNRPWEATPEGTELMNKALFKAWRETIKGDDTLINLGDVFFHWPKDKIQKTIQNLPGHKILVLGNHDRDHSVQWWREVGFDEVYPYPIIYRKWFILSHEEVFLNESMPYINIHGHHHQHKFAGPCYINVSVEQLGYKPVLFDSLVPKIESTEGLVKAELIRSDA